MHSAHMRNQGRRKTERERERERERKRVGGERERDIINVAR